jgi:hypothetical protein
MHVGTRAVGVYPVGEAIAVDINQLRGGAVSCVVGTFLTGANSVVVAGFHVDPFPRYAPFSDDCPVVVASANS